VAGARAVGEGQDGVVETNLAPDQAAIVFAQIHSVDIESHIQQVSDALIRSVQNVGQK